MECFSDKSLFWYIWRVNFFFNIVNLVNLFFLFFFPLSEQSESFSFDPSTMFGNQNNHDAHQYIGMHLEVDLV